MDAAAVPLPLGGVKQRAVLAMLVLQLNQAVSTDALMDGLWGDTVPASASNVIQTYVSRLRRILTSPGSDEPTTPRLRRRPSGYQLELDPECSDLSRFHRLSQQGQQHLPADPEAASALLREALDLWRGRPLAEFGGMPFAEAHAARLDEARLAVVMARVDADLMLGRHTELIPELAALVLSYPLHEGLCARLMISLFRSGRKADALKAFRRAQQVFIDELGIDPGRQLTELQAAILSADPNLEWRPRRSTSSTPAAEPVAVASDEPAAPGSPAKNTAARPRIWNVPARNPHFTGRADLITQLHDGLRENHHRLSVQALHGLGGVGKTQLIIEYAHRYAADYSLVWWVDAEQAVLIPDQLIALAGRMGLPTQGRATDIVDHVLTELTERSDWLLIVDNAEHPDDIAAYRPDGDGHLVITSRFPGWGALGGRVKVDVLSRRETVDLLKTRIPRIDSILAHSLAAELGDLPLAAAQAAAYLEQTETAPADYLRQFRAQRSHLLANGDVIGYQRRIDTAWSLSLERLRRIEPAAVELLEVGAILAPEPIPMTLFTNHPELLSGSLGIAAAAGLDRLADAVGAAVAFSLVQRQQDTFQMHRLVQAAIRVNLPDDRRRELESLAVALLAAYPTGYPSEPDTWTTYARIAPHVLATGPLADADPRGRVLLLSTLQYLDLRGNTRVSQVIAEQVLDRWRTILGPAHPSTLELAGTLTSALAWLGEGQRALELGQATLDKCEANLGPTHPITLSVATYVTSALGWLGENERAARLGHHTLQLCGETLGPEHPTTLGSSAQWAFTLLGLGEVESARQLSQETWLRSGRTLGTAHPSTLIAAAAYTFALAWLGEGQSARMVGLETAERCRHAFGTDHWLTITATAALTFAHVADSEYHRAAEVSRNIADQARIAFGPDHWVCMLASAARTFALIAYGDTEAAQALGADTLGRCDRILGPGHPIAVNLRQRLQILDGPPQVADPAV